VRGRIPRDPTIFVFTDDPNWVEANLEFPYETHVFKGADYTVPGHIGKEHVDLAMMSYCCNSIIANSSFHWWGAWLSERRMFGNTIVAPATWFADPTAQAHAGDIVPSRWIRV